MAVSLYRNQALGVSLVTLGVFSISITNILILFIFSNVPFLTSSAGFSIRFYPWILLTFFWIDSSMRASQDMDPLSRDSLHWRKVRYALWALNFAGVGVFMGFLIVTGNYGFFDNPSPNLVYGLSVMPYIVTPLSGVVALSVGALRSRDRNFRRQLQWFALSLLLLFGLSVLANLVPNNSPIQNDIYGVSFLTVGYCLYRSARSLVPLNKI